MHDRELRALASRQHGVVSVSQLRELGLGYAVVSARARAGRVVRLHRGVYAVGHTALTARSRWMAATLAAGPGAALCRRPAAALWDVATVPSGPVDVITSCRGRRGVEGIRLHRVRTLDPRDVTRVDGIPVTTVARTLVDLAATASSAHLERLVHEAELRRLLDLAAIDACIARIGAPRGVARLRAALGHWRDGPLRSKLEAAFAGFLERTDLPRPLRNVAVTADGRRYTVDALWPDQRLVVELDGHGAHGTRRAFERDRRRDAALHVAGHRVLRLTWRRLADDPDGVRRDLTRLLAAHP